MWGDDEVDSRDEEEKDEEALLCLMTLDKEINEVYDSKSSYSSDSYDNIDDLYQELYDSLVRAKKILKQKIIENDVLIEKLKSCEKENHDLNLLVKQLLTSNKPCAECKILK